MPGNCHITRDQLLFFIFISVFTRFAFGFWGVIFEPLYIDHRRFALFLLLFQPETPLVPALAALGRFVTESAALRVEAELLHLLQKRRIAECPIGTETKENHP